MVLSLNTQPKLFTETDRVEIKRFKQVLQCPCCSDWNVKRETDKGSSVKGVMWCSFSLKLSILRLSDAEGLQFCSISIETIVSSTRCHRMIENSRARLMFIGGSLMIVGLFEISTFMNDYYKMNLASLIGDFNPNQMTIDQTPSFRMIIECSISRSIH